MIGGVSLPVRKHNENLHGAVEFMHAAKKVGVKPILGAELNVDGSPLLLYVESIPGYHNLCRLLSRYADLRSDDESSVANQQRRQFRRTELDGLTAGLIAVGHDTLLAPLFPQRFYRLLTARAAEWDLPSVACPEVRCANQDDWKKFNIVQSVRTLTLLQQPHPEKKVKGRFHLRSRQEMTTACEGHPEWLRQTQEIAERCQFEFPFGKPQFPDFQPRDGSRSGF